MSNFGPPRRTAMETKLLTAWILLIAMGAPGVRTATRTASWIYVTRISPIRTVMARLAKTKTAIVFPTNARSRNRLFCRRRLMFGQTALSSINPNNPTAEVALRVELLDLACSTSGRKCVDSSDCKACVRPPSFGRPMHHCFRVPGCQRLRSLWRIMHRAERTGHNWLGKRPGHESRRLAARNGNCRYSVVHACPATVVGADGSYQ